jgi:hypothetical protein
MFLSVKDLTRLQVYFNIAPHNIKENNFNTPMKQETHELKIIGRITPSCYVLLEKLLVAQLLKQFPTLYGTQRFIIVLTRACHWSLS